jgi:hypothetical protein
MQNKKTSYQSADSISPHKFMLDYYPHRDHEQTPDEPIANEFNARIKELQDAGETAGLFAGETLIFINHNFGYRWDTIPYGQFDKVIASIQNGAHFFLNLVNPLAAAAIAEGNEKYKNMSTKEIVEDISKKFSLVKKAA